MVALRRSKSLSVSPLPPSPPPSPCPFALYPRPSPRARDGTWFQARAACEGAGARLCSFDELTAGLGWGTGCQSNKEYLWSGTPCSEAPADSYGWYFQVRGEALLPANCVFELHKKASALIERLFGCVR